MIRRSAQEMSLGCTDAAGLGEDDSAGALTLTVSGRGQALVWVPAGVWTSGRPPDLAAWAASSVAMNACPDRPVQFLGGLLAEDLETCINLTMGLTGQPERTVRRHLDGSHCA